MANSRLRSLFMPHLGVASEGLESFEASGLAPLHIELLDPGPPRPLTQVMNQELQIAFFTLGHHLYPAVRKVLGIAHKAELEGFFTGKVAITDALYLSADQNRDSQHAFNLQRLCKKRFFLD